MTAAARVRLRRRLAAELEPYAQLVELAREVAAKLGAIAVGPCQAVFDGGAIYLHDTNVEIAVALVGSVVLRIDGDDTLVAIYPEDALGMPRVLARWRAQLVALAARLLGEVKGLK